MIQHDITEFQPYYIQIVSQLLESRPAPVPDTYMQILPSLLQPPLWAARSNQPALTRLIKAYVARAGAQIVANQGTFHQILGLVQTLMVSKITDTFAFAILNAVICHVPKEKFPEFVPVLTNAALERFQKLPAASNGKFLRGLLTFLCLYMAKHGPDMLVDQLEGTQAGLTEQFVTHVMVPKLTVVVADSTDKKICQVGMTRLLCECARATQVLAAGARAWRRRASCCATRASGSATSRGRRTSSTSSFWRRTTTPPTWRCTTPRRTRPAADPLADVPDVPRVRLAALAGPRRAGPAARAPPVASLRQTYQL